MTTQAMTVETALNFGFHHTNTSSGQVIYFPVKEIKPFGGLIKGLTKFDSSSSISLSESSQSADSSFEMGKHSHKNDKKGQNFQGKKKTELCKTYQLGFACPYGSKCSFAHGSEELKPKVFVPLKYKTTPCKQFFGKDCCHFGPRCQFLHAQAVCNESKLEGLSLNLVYDDVLKAFNDECEVQMNFNYSARIASQRRLPAFQSCEEGF